MKRTAFKRATGRAWSADPDRVRSVPLPTPAFRLPKPVAGLTAQVLKVKPVRSEAYRRAVASLPCIVCGIEGLSQAAHGSVGKGMGLKACDLQLFPACCDQPGRAGCHGRLDQGAMLSKAERHEKEFVWAQATQKEVMARGLWPEKLETPPSLGITGEMK